MAKKVIGQGLWANLRADINSNFTEIYESLGSGGGGGADLYVKTDTLAAGVVTRITTTLTKEPYSVMILDSVGNIITHTLSIKILLVGDVYVLDIYSTETLANVKIKIVY